LESEIERGANFGGRKVAVKKKKECGGEEEGGTREGYTQNGVRHDGAL
jgi:hypothetical protein